ncbi:helix-turn-helix transcriptional regulator [Clostridium sp.]|uniref:helix-turn-helix domain-containing protein n=1 Tax=unclassified Clostridium TaxID=2614128 RepID=UPI001C8BCD02|nr:helix-turn-helix transcriptional regulator [Clostridium sp. K12(2020)]MBX9145562.1 helix-turn-helix transcriptional regulator [Clostridium sp. K13]
MIIFVHFYFPFSVHCYIIIYKNLKLGTFGEKLRYLRIERNLNQREFAKLLNYSFTSICNWEQGNRFPKIETIKEIAEILNVDYIFLKDH